MKQKVSLLVIVSLSLLAMVAGIVRLCSVLSLYTSKDTPCEPDDSVTQFDLQVLIITGDSYDIAIWSSVEVNTGLFCASAAAIKPLLRKLSPGLFTSIATQTSPSTLNSRNKLGTSGVSKFRSTADAIELHSQPDLGDTRNKVWADGKNSNASSDALEMGLFRREEILKTVSVTVTGRKGGDVEAGT